MFRFNIEVPVEPFLAEVKAEPTVSEQIKLFNNNRNTEASPSSERPGFKQPNRAIFEYMGFDPKSPFYEKVTPLTQAARTISAAGMTPTMLGGSPVAASMYVVPPFFTKNFPWKKVGKEGAGDAGQRVSVHIHVPETRI